MSLINISNKSWNIKFRIAENKSKRDNWTKNAVPPCESFTQITSAFIYIVHATFKR